MEKAYIPGLMVVDMKESSKTTLKKEKVFILITQDKNMLDHSRKIRNMEKENLLKKMEQKGGAHGRMGKD